MSLGQGELWVGGDMRTHQPYSLLLCSTCYRNKDRNNFALKWALVNLLPTNVKPIKTQKKKGKKRSLILLLNKKIIFTVFENHQKSPIWIFQSLIDLSGSFDRKVTFSPKTWQIEKWDIFSDFQPVCNLLFCTTAKPAVCSFLHSAAI